MQAALITKLASDPQMRQLAKQVGLASVRAVGRSRVRRQKRGQWYAGKRLGIPAAARVTVQRAPMAAAATWQKGPVANAQVIRASEVITPLTMVQAPTSDGFFTETYPLNPAEPHTFERLATMASLYQKYRIDQFALEYVTNLPTTTSGTVGFAMLADPTTAGPQSMSELSALANAVTSAIYSNIKIPLPAALQAQIGKTYLSKRLASPSAEDDSPFNTVGRLVFAIQSKDVEQNEICGNVIANYTFTFSEPRTAESGATCSGAFTGVSVDGESHADFTNRTTVGTPALFIEAGRPTVLRKRSIQEVQLVLLCGASTQPAHVDYGDDYVSPNYWFSGTSNSVHWFTIPRGKRSFKIEWSGEGTLNKVISFTAGNLQMSA